MRILILILFNVVILTAQNLSEGQKLWSIDRPLTVDDFKIKIDDINNEPIYSQFVIQINPISGFGLLKRNFNKKVESVFLGNASWIDTTRIESLDKQMKFQQMQFNIAEICTREMRKEILLNKNKLLSKPNLLQEILNKAMTTFSETRLNFVKDTEGGRNEKKLLIWKNKIDFRLKDLYEFDYENTKRIKVKKYKTK